MRVRRKRGDLGRSDDERGLTVQLCDDGFKHCSAPWPEKERLAAVAAKYGDRTPEELQRQCEETAIEIKDGTTPGDVLDYIEELSSDPHFTSPA